MKKLRDILFEDKSVKPDYIDLDKDGNTEEPMKQAAKDVNESEHAYKNSTNNELAMHIGQLQRELKAETDPKKQDLIKRDLESCKSELASRKNEAAKPDYIDLDKDGDTEETMKHAAADKEMENESLTPRDKALIEAFQKNLKPALRS